MPLLVQHGPMHMIASRAVAGIVQLLFCASVLVKLSLAKVETLTHDSITVGFRFGSLQEAVNSVSSPHSDQVILSYSERVVKALR